MHQLALAAAALAGSVTSLGLLLEVAWLLRPLPRYRRRHAAQSA